MAFLVIILSTTASDAEGLYATVDGINYVANFGGPLDPVIYRAWVGDNQSFIGSANIQSSVTFKHISFDGYDNNGNPIYSTHYYTSTITFINGPAFENCTGLTSINLPNTIEWIDQYAFWGCTNLTSVNLNSVSTVGQVSFHGCTSLTNITIPSSLTQIGVWAFNNCSSLKTIYWNAKNAEVSGAYPYDFPPFGTCNSLTRIFIGSEVEVIGDCIFRIDDNYNHIDTVTCLAITPPVITSNCFNTKTYNNAVLEVPEGRLQAYRNAEGWKDFFHIETISQEVIPGDVDGNGVVGMDDLTAMINYLVYGTPINMEGGDVDRDGVVGMDDLTGLINILLKR